MTTGEGADGRRDARDEHDQREQRGDRINVGGGDDSVTRMQLAARWAEAYGRRSDSLGTILRRFRAAYEYLDSVTHGVEPQDLDRELVDIPAISPPPVTPPPVQPVSQPAYGSTSSPPAPQSEPRPWG